MPPHCDTLDGPIVTAARKALESGNVNLILPFVPKEGETEVIQAFEKVVKVRKDPTAREVADLYFFETVVRIHRLGEGAPYEGLKPAGLSEGPVIPVAEKAIETGSPDELVKTLSNMVREEVTHRLEHVMHLKLDKEKSVEDARECVEAMLGLQVWSHSIYERIQGAAHNGHHQHGLPIDCPWSGCLCRLCERSQKYYGRQKATMNIHDDPNDIEYLASMKLQMCQTSDEQFQNSSLPVDCKEMKSE